MVVSADSLGKLRAAGEVGNSFKSSLIFLGVYNISQHFSMELSNWGYDSSINISSLFGPYRLITENLMAPLALGFCMQSSAGLFSLHRSHRCRCDQLALSGTPSSDQRDSIQI